MRKASARLSTRARAGVLLGVLAVLAFAGALPAGAQSVRAAGTSGCSAQTLQATNAVRSALDSAHRALLNSTHQRRSSGARGHIYYGRCRHGKYWALAAYSTPGLGILDQPEVLSREPGGRWRDLGDTGGDVSSSGVPTSLLRAWHYRFAWTTAFGRMAVTQGPAGVVARASRGAGRGLSSIS